jgi:hypothetical protein
VITRDVEASAVGDLALSPPRAALAVTADDEILVLPVSVNSKRLPIPRRRRGLCGCRRLPQTWPTAMSL